MKRKLIAILATVAMMMTLFTLPVLVENTDEADRNTASENENTTSGPPIESKLIALTFDDGPGKYTEQLLDAFAEEEVKATFFLVGANVKKFPEIVCRQYMEGHQIANHTWSHPRLTTLTTEKIKKELYQTEDIIDTVLGFDMGRLMLRPPYGSYDTSVQNVAEVPIVYWSVDTLDWKNRNAETVKNRIVNGAKDGAIILLHDIHKSSVEGTIDAIKELKRQGYTFVTVEELFMRKGISMEKGIVYKSAPDNHKDLGPTEPSINEETQLHEHLKYTNPKNSKGILSIFENHNKLMQNTPAMNDDIAAESE